MYPLSLSKSITVCCQLCFHCSYNRCLGSFFCFVLGDQLSLSTDSRNTDFGNIAQEEVIGRAEYALWPIRCFGNLTCQTVTAGGTEQEGME